MTDGDTPEEFLTPDEFATCETIARAGGGDPLGFTFRDYRHEMPAEIRQDVTNALRGLLAAAHMANQIAKAVIAANPAGPVQIPYPEVD